MIFLFKGGEARIAIFLFCFVLFKNFPQVYFPMFRNSMACQPLLLVPARVVDLAVVVDLLFFSFF